MGHLKKSGIIALATVLGLGVVLPNALTAHAAASRCPDLSGNYEHYAGGHLEERLVVEQRDCAQLELTTWTKLIRDGKPVREGKGASGAFVLEPQPAVILTVEPSLQPVKGQPNLATRVYWKDFNYLKDGNPTTSRELVEDFINLNQQTHLGQPKVVVRKFLFPSLSNSGRLGVLLQLAAGENEVPMLSHDEAYAATRWYTDPEQVKVAKAQASPTDGQPKRHHIRR